MKYLAFIFALALASCIPENAKRQINQQMTDLQKMMADKDFKSGIALIELHKVRYGSYPGSLKELTFLNMMDSSIFNTLAYQKLDNGYELNIKASFPTFSGEVKPVDLKYPDEFWKGLGCVKSNAKE